MNVLGRTLGLELECNAMDFRSKNMPKMEQETGRDNMMEDASAIIGVHRQAAASHDDLSRAFCDSKVRKMSLSGRRGGHVPTMLNYKRKRSPLPKTRCSSPIMSVFASMSTKPGQGAATFPKDGAGLATGPKPLAEEATEEQDKYPCLRRALSCTETPILPLGTYAVEFGFDVSTLPFSPLRRSMFSLPEAPKLRPCSQSPPELRNPVAKPNCDKSGRVSETVTASNQPCCSMWPGHDFRARIASSSTADAPAAEDQPFQKTDRPSEATHQPCKRRPPESSPQNLSGTPLPGAEAAAEPQPISLEAYRNEPADALYATVWKKDKRAWLWKAGNKTGQPGSHDHYLVAKQFKKDNRTWLWKSSSKKRRTDVDS